MDRPVSGRLSGRATDCTCYHAPEQHGSAGCGVLGCECSSDGWLREAVNSPAHYGGADNPYEAIKVIEAWDLGFCLGNTVKYIARAGKKDPASSSRI